MPRILLDTREGPPVWKDIADHIFQSGYLELGVSIGRVAGLPSPDAVMYVVKVARPTGEYVHGFPLWRLDA